MDNNHRKNEQLKETSGTSEKFDLYIKKVLKTRIINAYDRYVREKGRYVLLPLEAIEELFPGSYEFKTDLHGVRLGNSVIYLQNERLAQAMKELNPRYKQVLGLSVVCGYTVAEIAEELGVKEESVMQYKWQAAQDLRKMMEDDSYGENAWL